MRPGDTVAYIDIADARHQATIKEVGKPGPSNFKTLDLVYRSEGEDVTAEGVPHENDAEAGQAFWLEKGVQRRSIEEREANPVEVKPEADVHGRSSAAAAGGRTVRSRAAQ